MTRDNISNAAFHFDLAVRQLREYASLIHHGVERPINIELAMNNIRAAMNDLKGCATFTSEPHQVHGQVKAARLRELRDELGVEIRIGH